MSSPPPPPPPQPPPLNHHHPNSSHILPFITAAFATLSLLLLLIFFLYRRLNHLSKHPHSSSSAAPRRLSYSSLRRATANFHPSRRIGQGGSSLVFSTTTTLKTFPFHFPLAVKVLDAGSLQSEREFHNELQLAPLLVDSDRLVKLLGFASHPKRRRLCLVYPLMPNGNLQDCLLHKKPPELTHWNTRFRIAIEIAEGLAYLHHQCNPPVIHGDVKPSNVLLDEGFSAKIADFGLARLKLGDGKDGFDDGIDNNTAATNDVIVDVGENMNGGLIVEDIGSVLETESLSTTVAFEEGSVGVDQSPAGFVIETSPEMEMVTAVASPSEFEGQFDVRKDVLDKGSDLECQFDRVSVEISGKDPKKEFLDKGSDLEGQFGRKDVRKENGDRKNTLGKELLRKQENVGGVLGSGRVKDYVMEWIGKEVGKERPNGEWVGATSSSNVVNETPEKSKKGKSKLDWWGSRRQQDGGRMSKKERRKPVREWWKEEYTEELSRKNKKNKKTNHLHKAMSADEDHWWPRDHDEMYIDHKKEKKKRSRSRMSSSKGSSVDWWLDGGWSGELWKAQSHHQHTTGPYYDSMSGEIPRSGGTGISSTPSMRGTVFYVAPEYSIGGDLSEKCDVYSFGVLLLVLVSGRRPLQVTGSPMSEFHRANLISWARQLARSKKLLELVDKNVHSLNVEEAELCIVVALVCLQKNPARRPSMKEVVGMLTGEVDPPQLPAEYRSYKSRKKLR